MGWTVPFMCLSPVQAHVPGFGCKHGREWDLARRRRGRLLIMTDGSQGGNSLSINTHGFFARKSYFFKWRCSGGIVELVLFFCS
uniref:Uncharacterized protein n=1 Tax=Physcomitrium patens TaxID=3218 RepID=A0A7I4C6C0_PHYPA